MHVAKIILVLTLVTEGSEVRRMEEEEPFFVKKKRLCRCGQGESF